MGVEALSIRTTIQQCNSGYFTLFSMVTSHGHSGHCMASNNTTAGIFTLARGEVEHGHFTRVLHCAVFGLLDKKQNCDQR